MTETRETLEARKRDLFAAIRTLDADYDDGTLDEAVYRSTRERYEREAADVLAHLDALAEERRPVVSSPPRRRRPMATLATLLAIGGVILVILLGAIQRGAENNALSRTPSQSPTATSRALTKAMEAVLKNPRSAPAQMALGNAYFKLGETSQADAHYRAAARLAPSDPRPVTLHAMVLGSGSHRVQALRILRGVEERHPRYARAWLLDGLLSSHARATYPRAIHSWKRFLALQPNGPLAANVRHLIAAARKAESSRK